MLRAEHRRQGILIAVYAALAVLGLVLETPGPPVIGFSIAVGFAIGRFHRLSELREQHDRDDHYLN